MLEDMNVILQRPPVLRDEFSACVDDACCLVVNYVD